MTAHNAKSSRAIWSEPGNDPPPSGEATAKPWLQWILIYPTLFVSIVGSIPTVAEIVRAHALDVSPGQSTAAQQQIDLWARNLDCVGGIPFRGITSEARVQVDATFCKSGDVLVRYQRAGETTYRWLPMVKFDQPKPRFSIVSSAKADELQQQSATLVCQWAANPGLIIRRVRDSDTNQCFNEYIRSATGVVEQRRNVSCDSPCGQ
jgi:hypothetical protein